MRDLNVFRYQAAEMLNRATSNATAGAGGLEHDSSHVLAAGGYVKRGVSREPRIVMLTAEMPKYDLVREEKQDDLGI